MSAPDYSDLSRLALESELDVAELRARLARMSNRALLDAGAPRPTCARHGRISGTHRESCSSCSSRRPESSGAAGTAGIKPDQIQLSLGHASLTTTERYLGVHQNLTDARCDYIRLDLSAAEYSGLDPPTLRLG
jgi:hypothetical protein